MGWGRRSSRVSWNSNGFFATISMVASACVHGLNSRWRNRISSLKKQVLRQISLKPPTNFLCPTFLLGHFSIDFTDWRRKRRRRVILMCSCRVCFLLSFENEEIATSSCSCFQGGSENSTPCYHTTRLFFSVVHLGEKSGHARPCYSIQGIFAFVVAVSSQLIVSLAALRISRAIFFQLLFFVNDETKTFLKQLRFKLHRDRCSSLFHFKRDGEINWNCLRISLYWFP